MYPFIRIFAEIRRARKQKPIGLFDQQRVTVRIYPWDLDIFRELNNGRALTLYDIARISLSVRSGLDKILRQNKWGITVAGSFVRYRKRVTLWQKIEITAQCIGIDDRFYYMLQNMYRNGEPVGQALYRAAVTQNGLVKPYLLAQAAGIELADVPILPAWVQTISLADMERPWPPEENSNAQ